MCYYYGLFNGQNYHDEPEVRHCGRNGDGVRLDEGMIFTIEPMINVCKPDTKEMSDGWTVVTRDHSLSAQGEHMVAVTAEGYGVWKRWPAGTGA